MDPLIGIEIGRVRSTFWGTLETNQLIFSQYFFHYNRQKPQANQVEISQLPQAQSQQRKMDPTRRSLVNEPD